MTAAERAAMKVQNWSVNGVHLPPYMPSLEEFAEHLKKELWSEFIERLNQVQPLGRHEDEPIRHKNFLGSIEKYERIYMGKT